MRCLVVLILLCFSVNYLKGQSWQPIGITEGLSQGMVYDLVHDQQGFLWAATKDGLNRYDGYNFKVFTHDPYNPLSISGNTCTALLEDGDWLWVGTEKDGLNLFEKRTQRFFRINIADKDLKGSGNYGVYALGLDKHHNLLVFTNNPHKVFSLERDFRAVTKQGWSPKGKFLKPHELPLSYAKTSFRASLKFPYAQVLYQAKHPAVFEGAFVPQASALSYFADQANRLWVLGLDQLVCSEAGKTKVIKFAKQSDITAMNPLDDGSLAISNQKHLWIFRPEALLQLDALTPANAFALVPTHCNSFRRDLNGNMWATTGGHGLYKFNPNVKKFKAYLPGLSPSFLLKDQQGRIYFHANYTPSYHFYQFDTLTNQYKPVATAYHNGAWGHDALCQDQVGYFWLIINARLNPTERLLLQYDPNWQFVKAIRLPPLSVTSDFSCRMLSVVHRGAEKLVIGLANGMLLWFDPTTEQFKSISYQHLLPKSGAIVGTYALFYDAPSTLWVGTQKGLIRIKNAFQSPQYTIFSNSTTNRASLSNDFVSSVINDPYEPTRYLWVSTKGGGLERFDKTTEQFRHFSEAQGLPNKVVYGVLIGDDKNLWMSTNRGIARLNTKTFIFGNYNKLDGLQDEEFNTNSYHKAPTGELFFGGINGFNVFRASSISNQAKIPEVKIIGLKVNNTTVEANAPNGGLLPTTIEYLPKLELSHDQNILTLEFGVMDFTNPAKNRFRYRLKGIHDDWVEAGTNRFANYAQLPAGSYTFELMGSTNGEVWSQPVVLAIQIHPPFYLTWWAYLCYAGLVLALAYYFFAGQLRRIRLQEQLLYQAKEAERLTEIDHIKTRFFTNVSHEFRTPLSLLAGPLQDLAERYPQESLLGLMKRNLHRLQELINQLLDLSKLDAGQMNLHPQEIDLVRFFEQLFASFESLASSKSIRFVHHQNSEAQGAFVDVDKLEKIVVNLLANALKFSPDGGQVSVAIRYELAASVGELVVTVQDSGIGIAPERLGHIFDRFYRVDDASQPYFEGTGIGLALVKELVEVLEGRIEVRSEPHQQTTFEVRLPFAPLQHARPHLNYAVASPPPSVERVEDTQLPLQSADQQAILLVVEDNQDLRQYISQIFLNDYHVVTATDGEQGLAKAIELIPDVVVSDLMMPKLDGLALCEKLKTDERTNHIPVVMLTAKAGLADRLLGLDKGADDYLPKPFSREELVVRVRNLVLQRQLLRQKFSAAAATTPAALPTLDEQFVKRALAVIDEHLADSGFEVERFANQMNVSSVQLRRKLKAITDQTVIQFVRNYRLDKAAYLLKNQQGTVSEIAYRVGFESVSYFSKVFQERFGKAASEWR
jgi:signal transduction histidine kinase/AraC-like DNA-binding protein/ligand-binding sensor domain-containing protein